MRKRKIILTSTSLQRKKLLEQIGLNFEIVGSNYEEDMSLDMPPNELAMFLAKGKAEDVAKKIDSGIIIAADTFVAFEGKVIGKPKDADDANRILKMISGKYLKVYSGLALIDAKTKKCVTDYEMSKAKIKNMSEDEIKSYIQTGEPLNKAGAFGIQDLGAVFVERVEGCYFNIVGLPLHCLYENLRKLGVNVFDNT